MLVQFSVKNFRSIKEELVFSLVKEKGNELGSSNSFEPNSASRISLLRSAAIYGANAAGKSNVIRAMHTMERIVRHSASAGQVGKKIPVTPFLFDEESADKPSEFEMIFISEGVRYQYGFAITKYQVVEEWLFAFPNGRAQNWFVRENDINSGKSVYKFGDSLFGAKSVWKNATRDNALFLSTAVQLNSEQLKPVFNWFDEKLYVSQVGGWSPRYTLSQCEDPTDKKNIVEFLKAADFDIHDIFLDKKPFDAKSLPEELPAALREKMAEDLADETIVDVKTVHMTANNKPVYLDLEEESDGTRALFSFAGYVIEALKSGDILVIDELHNHLHPKMVEYLLRLFHSSECNPNNAQLIFTTHETSILNQEVLRRDQVWFCEKDGIQATTIYPLSDFSPRKGRENIEVGYLSGRYGALPFLKAFALAKEL